MGTTEYIYMKYIGDTEVFFDESKQEAKKMRQYGWVLWVTEIRTMDGKSKR